MNRLLIHSRAMVAADQRMFKGNFGCEEASVLQQIHSMISSICRSDGQMIEVLDAMIFEFGNVEALRP